MKYPRISFYLNTVAIWNRLEDSGLARIDFPFRNMSKKPVALSPGLLKP